MKERYDWTNYPGYPKTRYEWRPEDGFQMVPDKLWWSIMGRKRDIIRAHRKRREPFRIVETFPNHYRVETLPKTRE